MIKKKERNCQHLVATHTHGSANVGLASPRPIEEGSSDPLRKFSCTSLQTEFPYLSQLHLHLCLMTGQPKERLAHYWSERVKFCIFPRSAYDKILFWDKVQQYKESQINIKGILLLNLRHCWQKYINAAISGESGQILLVFVPLMPSCSSPPCTEMWLKLKASLDFKPEKFF